MWPFTPSRGSEKPKLVRFHQLHKKLVPPMGECETWQGEVIRIIANAEDEANRNGFINWDEEDDRDISLFVERLCADDTFEEEKKAAIRDFGHSIKLAGRDSDASSPQTQDWEFLFACAVDWIDAHPDPIPLREDGGYIGHY
jgi:hypothetical protein